VIRLLSHRSKNHVIAFVVITLVLAALLSVFVLQQLASQGQVSNQKDALQSDAPNLLNATTPTLTDEPTPTPTPAPASTPTPTPIPIPVDFTVKGDNLTLTVNVDLNDGMNREEAILVAQQVFAYVHSSSTNELKSAEVNEAGVWTVSLPWGAVLPDGYQESHGHYFIATIDPMTRIVEYKTCF
jgi:cytoskeletal protein RodZ